MLGSAIRQGQLEQARAYFVCGGIPHYLRCFAQERSLEANIVAVLLDEFGALFAEPAFLLREELRDLERFFSVLWAIATGNRAPAQIARASGVPDKSLAYYLKTMQELHYVRRRQPLSGSRPRQRDVAYVLDDPMLAFWFRFVYPNQSALLRDGPEAVFDQRIKGGLPAYFGHAFERLCREALPFLYRAEGIGASYEVGEYWSPNAQIDVVGVRDDHWIDLGECKWQSGLGAHRNACQHLNRAIQHFPNPRGATLSLRVFSRSAADTHAHPNVRFHSLEDLYSIA